MSALRVYLFADFGKGPKAVGTVSRCAPDWPGCWRGAWYLTGTQKERAARARRWWLVECASAARGRLLIAASLDGGDPLLLDEGGRILDSGGAS